MKKLLGIILAMVMVIGSISPAMAYYIDDPDFDPWKEENRVDLDYGDNKRDWYMQHPKSLLIQLEQGIKDPQCSNPDHVLVFRTHGKLACVFESTADKKNWQIMNP